MADTLIFSKPYGTVQAAPAARCLLVEWLGFANAADFLALQEAVLTYFEAHSTPARPWGVVGDTRRMGAIPARVQQWLITDFTPRIVAAGLREMSVVVAQDVFAQLATQHYAQHTAQATDAYALPVAYYDSPGAALTGARAAQAQPGA